MGSIEIWRVEGVLKGYPVGPPCGGGWHSLDRAIDAPVLQDELARGWDSRDCIGLMLGFSNSRTPSLCDSCLQC